MRARPLQDQRNPLPKAKRVPLIRQFTKSAAGAAVVRAMWKAKLIRPAFMAGRSAGPTAVPTVPAFMAMRSAGRIVLAFMAMRSVGPLMVPVFMDIQNVVPPGGQQSVRTAGSTDA